MAQPIRGSQLTSCVHQLALRWGPPQPVPVTPLSPELAMRRRDAARHREGILNQISSLHADAVWCTSPDDTDQAMRHGAPLLLSPHLRDDDDGRRAHCDVLIRVGRRNEMHTYAPILVRHAEIVTPASTRVQSEGTLARLAPSAATPVMGVAPRDAVTRHGLNLVHTLTVLHAFGHGDDQWRGGLVDRAGRVWWYHLASADYPRFNRDAYARYFDERRSLALEHDRWLAYGGDFPTRAAWHKNCDDCFFASHCGEELAATDDVSLVRFTNFDEQALLREHGITTRRALAGLDARRAAAAHSLSWQALHDDSPLEDVLGSRIDKLPELIYRARATVQQQPLRIVPPEKMVAPTADVEVDVDMESYGDATYFWGMTVRSRQPLPGITEGYHAFVTFEELTPEREAGVFADFWQVFLSLRKAAQDHGATFAAYCFWAPAENGAMDRAVSIGGPGVPTAADVRAFRSSGQWIDMHAIARALIQTEGPLGLKVLARLAGFSWRDESPSGEASMGWYETACENSPDSVAAQQRLLAYNEDDCVATRALRDWINGPARELPHRDDQLDPH